MIIVIVSKGFVYVLEADEIFKFSSLDSGAVDRALDTQVSAQINVRSFMEMNKFPLEILDYVSRFLSEQDCLSFSLSGVCERFSSFQGDKR